GVLTLSGTSVVANYQTALRSVTFSSSSEDPSTAVRTVTFQVDDGGSPLHLSNAINSTVNVTNVNDAPTAISYCASGCTNAALSAQAGIPITFAAGKLGGSDVADEVANGSVVTLNTTPDSTCVNCSLTINANGSFTFT